MSSPPTQESITPTGAPRDTFWRRLWCHDRIERATVVVAVATVVNVLVSAGLLLVTYRSVRVAEKVFAAANRPYVGVDAINVDLDTLPDELHVAVMLKNFGTAPAERFQVDGDLLINGSPGPVYKTPGVATTLFPGTEITMLRANIRPPVLLPLLDGSGTLTLLIRFSYSGPDGTGYSYNQEAQFDPRNGEFMNLGPPTKK